MSRPAPTSAHRDRDLGQPRNRRSRDESGSILVLFSIFIGLFLLCCAIVIDVGYWWANAKKAQIAADACALAAARELPKKWGGVPPGGGPPEGAARTECQIGGAEYVFRNIPDQSDPNKGAKHLFTRVVSPYDQKEYQVEATVRLRVRTFFGRIVGSKYWEIERRAVAERSESTGNYAIYSHDSTGCADGEGLEFDGDNISINGLVHSNGWYNVNSASPPDGFWAADGTMYTLPPGAGVCTPKLHPYPDGAQYGDGPDFLPRDTTLQEWPVWFTPGMFGWQAGCDYSGEKIEIEEDRVKISNPDDEIMFATPNVVPTGTYCATEVFEFKGNGEFCNDPLPDVPIVGQITALARTIKINGSCLHLTPNDHNVLLFAVPNNDDDLDNDGALPGGNPECKDPPEYEMQLGGEDQRWSGFLFSPCGRVYVNVKDSTVGSEFLTGTIIAEKVKINSDQFAMIGKNDFGADITIALVE